MKTIEQVEKFNDKKFQKTFGVNRKTFETMLEVLQEQFQKSHKKGGRKPTDVQSQILPMTTI